MTRHDRQQIMRDVLSLIIRYTDTNNHIKALVCAKKENFFFIVITPTDSPKPVQNHRVIGSLVVLLLFKIPVVIRAFVIYALVRSCLCSIYIFIENKKKYC